MENKINKLTEQNTLTVALAGNPNCGKTTLFNALTGLKYKVANYPGVTVEKKKGKLCLLEFNDASLLDLPGIYSLVGTSIDEKIATALLKGELKDEKVPDCIVAVIDSSNLERNLYLVTQLIDLGIPLILALNMQDLAQKKGIIIQAEILSKLLDLPVVSIVANKAQGLDFLRSEISKSLSNKKTSAKKLAWREFLEAKDEDYGAEATARYQYISDIIKKCCVQKNTNNNSIEDKFDRLSTHKIWGTLLFISIMSFFFQAIYLWSEVPMNMIDSLIQWLSKNAAAMLPNGELESLIVDGVIAGVGNVLVFIPQIALLFFFLGILEDTGYLARAAFLMDRIMRPFGLQGRSFIPLLNSFGCAIPGIMSSRTIPSRADRLATILVAPLMSCSARLPVYTVLIAAFIPNEHIYGIISLPGICMLAMYLLGIIGAAIIAWALKLSVLRGKPAIFLMELPSMHLPSMKNILREVLDRALTFIQSAGTTILACSIILWAMASYPKAPADYKDNPVKYSIAGRIGTAMEPVIKPLGFNWEIGVGILASFAAREVFISSLSTVYNLASEDDDNSTLIETLKQKKSDGSFSTASAISLMIFYVFACQCMSTLAICKKETGSWGWTAFMFIYMTTLAYICSLIFYQTASTL